MFARFQDIKNGALEGEGAINNVEAALSRVTLASGEQMSIMNRQTGEFKDFSEVIEQLSTRWDSLNEMEQANIVKAFAGVRQRESFLALMENQETMHYLLAEAIGAEGLAADRFSIYLEGLEAAQNKATAAWEGMVQATIEGDLVKTFYEASASVSEFITSLGGFDTVLIGVAAGIMVYLIPAISALTATLSLNPLGLVAIGIGLIAIEIGNLITKSKEIEETFSSIWQSAMEKVSVSTSTTKDIIDEYTLSIKKLNREYEDSPWYAKLFIDEQKNIEKGLREFVPLLQDSADSLGDYNDGLLEMASQSGYLVDAQGRLYTTVGSGINKYAVYLDGVTTLNEEQWRFIKLNPAIVGGYKAIEEQVSDVVVETDKLTGSFQSLLNATEELSKGDAGISGLLEDFSQLNELFKQGLLAPDEYFAQVSNRITSLDMQSIFDGNSAAAETFFTGLILSASDSLSLINSQWNKGESTIVEYTDQLAGVGDMFIQIGEASSLFGENETVSRAIEKITGGVESLSAAQDANIHIQNAMYEITQKSLDFGTDAYNKQMRLVADAMYASGVAYTTIEGNALSSAESIYGYLTATSGNFQILTGQSADATGQMTDMVINGAGMMLDTLAGMIDSFDANISFVPTVTWPTMVDILGTMNPLPEINYSVGAKVSHTSAPISGGRGTFVPSKNMSSRETGGISDQFRMWAEQLKNFKSDFSAASYKMPEGMSPPTLPTSLGGSGGGSSSDASSAELDAIDELKKARLDALKDQLDGYKQVIDARKKLLDTMQDELDYQRKLSDKQSSLSRIQSEIEELRLDDSEEAQARRRALEEEASEIQIDIAESQVDRQIEIQKDALDAEYENFKRYIEWQMAAIENPASAGAMPLALPTYHSGGIVGSSGSGSGEVVARLLSGELVSTQSDMETFINKTLPSMLGTTVEMRGDMGGFSIGNLIELTVQGNLDTSVMPEIDAIADRTIQKINDIMQKRGLTRTANQFSI